MGPVALLFSTFPPQDPRCWHPAGDGALAAEFYISAYTHTWACATHKQFNMQAVAVAIAKATWAWVRGKCEEAMREVLGAGRGVQAGEVETPAMVAEARRETKWGAESDEDEEGDGGDGAQDSERVRLRNTY